MAYLLFVNPFMCLQVGECLDLRHIWSMHIAFHLSGFFHVSSSSRPCGYIYVSSNHFLGKCLVALGAGKLILTSVDPFMSLQILFYVNVLSHLERVNSFSHLSLYVSSSQPRGPFHVSNTSFV